MYPWETLNLYSQHHPRWFEAPGRYPPTSAHLAVFRKLMPNTWRLRRRGMWYIADPPDAELAMQGWKLHVSARFEDSAEVLGRSIPALRDSGTHFKFLLDPGAVSLASNKLWPRGSSGKFITVYPADGTTFRHLAAELSRALADFAGPYILSDRRVPGSRVVYYRYGGFRGIPTLNVDGTESLNIITPDGLPTPDVRHPYWNPPAWATDPYETADDEPTDSLAGGRFTITEAIGFTNRGGIYRATDHHSGQTVIIKEARPHVRVGSCNAEAIEVLEKEYRLLRRLAGSGWFVRPVAFFREWEHAFLVEEYVESKQLSQHSIAINPVLTLEISRESLRAYFATMRALWLQVADAIDAAHRAGVLIGDVSFTNVLVTDGDTRVVLIDLEAAVAEGDAFLGMYTIGLSSPRMAGATGYDRANDYHALGALMLGSIAVVNSTVGFHRPTLPGFLDALSEDLGLPPELPALIANLMDEQDLEPAADVVRKRIAELPFDDVTAFVEPRLGAPATLPIDSALAEQVDRTVAEVTRYLLEVAEPTRTDRLFPADLMVFETNPLSVAHGAMGVLHTLHTIRGEVPAHLVGWALAQPVDNETYPPGLYSGQAGIAWVYAELGYPEIAMRLLDQARDHELRWRSTGVLRGCAGYGMACLKVWMHGGERRFLDDALQVAERLAATAVRDDRGARWPEPDGPVRIGYAHGASGVALFLLYLYLVTNQARWHELGRAALDFDLSHATRFSARVVAFPALSEPDDPNAAKLLRDFWDEGTAGVVSTLVRYLAAGLAPDLAGQLRTLVADCCRKYAVLPQLFHGLAGLGNAVLDGYEFTGDEAYLAEAWRTAEGTLLFGIDRPEGLVFPGEQAARESADLASGSAGVALFLHRLTKTGPGGRTNTNFTLDELLPPGTTPLP